MRVSRAFLALLVLVSLAVGIDNLDRALANPDEGRYSEISREMAATGDWVTPRLNGIKYFEKPPLQYWATAASFTVFGVDEWSARLYVALCGLATLLLVAFTAMRLGTAEQGLATMIVLVSSPYFIGLGGVVTLDMGLTLWTSLTLCAYLLAERPALEPRARRNWMLLAWVGIALAVLSKGLVGLVFPAAALGLLCLARFDFSPLARLEWSYGLTLFFGIAAPWFVLVSFANPEFPEFFFVHEHFQRFLTSTHRRTEPAWYFLPILAAGFLPWMFALPSALAQGWRSPLRFPILWGAFIVAFFSLSGSKLPAYILPAFPALALVLGRYLAEAPARQLAWRVIPGLLVAGALLFAAWKFPDRARDDWTRQMYAQAQPLVLIGAGIYAALSLLAPWLLWTGRRWLALVTVAIGMVLVIDCVEEAYEHLTPRQSGRAVAEKMKPLLASDTRVYSVAIYDQTIPFYIGRTVTLVDYLDEFELGLKSDPARHLRLEEFTA
ncbi:MAG TPA: phospholipid carrier-dependent glycosyltransferase, partial [Usitatibacter sp.]|nr:phospholipid carrier-dependent glycosyltransferase [Usitatibacter sp.]